MVQFPEGKNLSHSEGEIVKIGGNLDIDKGLDKYEFSHKASTELGSSGSPIFLENTTQVIGIHKQSDNFKQINYGDLIFPIVDKLKKANNNNKKYLNKILDNENQSKNKNDNMKKEVNLFNNKNDIEHQLNNLSNSDNRTNIKNNNSDNNKQNKNEIKMTIKIDKYHINNVIYFLDNTDGSYLINDKFIEHNHDCIKELNESNVELYINNIRYKYNKFFIPEKEGFYNILIKFNILMTDCSFMLYGCNKIIELDLSLFNTNNVTNMNRMFDLFEKIEKINLSNFNTQNVTNMECMFMLCMNKKILIYLHLILKM